MKELIIEDNLKQVGLLSPRVGSICPFYKFKNGKAVRSKNNDEDLEEVDADEDLLQEKNENIEIDHKEVEVEDSEETIEDGTKDASFV